MVIKTLENNNGFCLYKTESKKGKLYKWGYALIELANADFSPLRNLLRNEDIPFNKTYKEFFEKYLELNIESTHYQAIQFCIVKFMHERIQLLNDSLDIDDNSIVDYNTLKIYEPHKFLWDFQRLIWPLLYCNEKARNILNLLVCNDEKMKNKKKTDILKANSDKLTSFYFDYDTNITQFDSNKQYANFKYVCKNNKLFTTHTYYSIPELCNYELFKFLCSPTKIIRCKECNKFLVVKSAKKQFCSQKCKEKYNRRNPFYDEYRKTYQNIHKLHYEDGCVEPWENDVKPHLKELLNKYTKHYGTPNQDLKLKEFTNKLSKIKNQE